MANNLRALRDQRGWSQDEAATALATTRNQYAKLEAGSRRLSDKWIKRASEAYGIDPGEVVTDRTGAVPVAGYVGAGSQAHFYSESQGPFGEVPAPDNSTPQTVAVELRGESLGPFFNGWLVFFDDVRSPVTDDLIGRLCVVGLTDDRVLIKKLLRGRTAQSFELHGQFGEPIVDAEVAWAAPVKSVVPR